MSYLDIGYDIYLNKRRTSDPERLSRNEIDTLIPTFPGEKIDSPILGSMVGPGVDASVINKGKMPLDRLYGGTMTVGGFSGAYGRMVDLDEDGNLLGSMGSDGFKITKGDMEIRDRNRQIFMDSFGLVSNAFRGDIVSDTNAFTTNSTSYTDVTNMSLNFSVARGVKILVGATVTGQNDSIGAGNSDNCYSAITLDNNQVGGTMATPGEAILSVIPTSAGTTALVNIAPGAHNLKLRVKAVGAGTADLVGTEPKVLWYVILGS